VAVQERDLNADNDFADDDEVVYYHSSTLLSVYALSDASESVIERYRYDAYGACTVLDADGSVDGDGLSDVKNPYTFTARRLDAETGLMQYRFRDYSPALGRFLQRDPIGYWGGLSLYAYAWSCPAVAIDPWGLRGLPATGTPGATVPNPEVPGGFRAYGPDGWAEYDFDPGHTWRPGRPFDPAHHGPHHHHWDWSKTPPRQTPGHPTPLLPPGPAPSPPPLVLPSGMTFKFAGTGTLAQGAVVGTVVAVGAVVIYVEATATLNYAQMARELNATSGNYNAVIYASRMEGQKAAQQFLGTLGDDALCPCGVMAGTEGAMAACKDLFVGEMEIAYAGAGQLAFSLVEAGLISGRQYAEAIRTLRAQGVVGALGALNDCLSENVCCPCE